MRKLKNEEGITLIALVITIIVLLILAGVAVTTLTGDNGLLQKTTDAKIASEEAKLQEEVRLALIENEANKYTNPEAENSLKKIFEKIHGEGNIESITKNGKNYKVVVKNSNIRYRISSDGKVTKYEEMQPTNVYAKLDTDGTLYLKATEDNSNGYKTYTGQASIQANWSDKTPASVTKVIIEEPIAPTNTTFMFGNCTNLETIENIEKFHTENCTSFYGMFKDCSKLTQLDVTKFETGKSNNIAEMFNGCSSLISLDVSNFDTSKITNMYALFNGCNSLTNIDVSGFDTSNVNQGMSSMFSGCSSLTSLDVSGFDTSNVTSMNNMFSNCCLLTKLSLSNFNTSKVTSMTGMFQGCSSLTNLDLTSFDTSEVTTIQGMFGSCSSLQNLDISSFNTNKVNTTFGMYIVFNECQSLKNLKLGKNFIIHDEAVYNGYNIISQNPSDIKVVTTQEIATQVKKYSNLKNENFEIIN